MRKSLLKSMIFCLLSISLISFCKAANATQIWYVMSNPMHSEGNGKSWDDAFHSLTDALQIAESGDEVWVSSGIYYPDTSNPKVSFILKSNVAIYGGFRGTENELSQRDFKRNLSVLSGNIGKGNKKNNTITIVKGANGAILDGFVIQDAYSSEDQTKMHLTPKELLKNDLEAGGGMRNYKVSPIVKNCIFRNNSSVKGGAVYNLQESMASQAQFINVTFENNYAQIRGGAVSNDLGAMPTFINCRFINNHTDDKGGAMYNDFAASPIIINSLFESNIALSAAAIGNDGGSSPLLVNVTIKNNHATSGLGNGLYQGTGANNNPIVVNSFVDEVYNWHEDIVAVFNSVVAKKQSIALAKFIPVSSLLGKLSLSDLKQVGNTSIGYHRNYDGSVLVDNPLVHKLIGIYHDDGGNIAYRNEYTRPAIAPYPAFQGSIIYVAPDSNSRLKDGSSWEHPLVNLQQAINLAAQTHHPIWLKSGVYQNDQGPSIAAYILYDNVKIYGGFAGYETSIESRNIDKNPTILTARTTSSKFNFPHVFYGADGVILDGLIIRDGKANGYFANGKGGGLLAYHAGKTFWPRDNPIGFSMTIANCKFVNNNAEEGGAIYAFGKAKLVIINTQFKSNSATYGGAIMDREGNQISCDHCVFTHNRADMDGGAVYTDYGSHSNYYNSLFVDNSAQRYANQIYIISRASQLEATQITIESSVLSGSKNNLANYDDSQVLVVNSKINPKSYKGKIKIVN